ncbi:ATP-binding protein [Priestia abyssalis]|uniref:ATP-binding protein n=1 Tax=Priestia abyssalis TaxID=1221450 RepID=UPI000994CC43|nr:ATP-binding protein [Priestia abyssalis]
MMHSFASQSKMKTIQLYLLIVLLPSVIISGIWTQFRIHQLEAERMADAQQLASFHKNYLDRFIGETVTSIETIALTSNPKKESHQYIESILAKAHHNDLRLSGLYFCDIKGNMLFGSHPLQKQVNVYDRDFFQSVLETKLTTISNAYYGRLTGRYIVTIATPVLDSNNHIQAILLAVLRLNYLASVMTELTPETDIQVFDRNRVNILEFGKTVHVPAVRKAETYLDRIPWSVAVAAQPISTLTIATILIISLISSSITTSILFLVLKIWLLKRQSLKERIQTEAQKIELVGTLAASTAHEIRNPLTGIKGLITLLSEKHQDEEDQYYFSVIQTEINRINQIVSEFLVLGKPTAEHRQNHNISEIIKELQPIIESESHLHNVEFIVSLPLKPLLIHCTKDQVKQVLLNLTKNALDSMPRGGNLTLSVIAQNNECIIKVKDTGEGIPKERLHKIFHPFYTSKDTGTGLGLVVCKRIIEMYDGTISIDSIVKKGTEVTIHLPLIHK